MTAAEFRKLEGYAIETILTLKGADARRLFREVIGFDPGSMPVKEVKAHLYRYQDGVMQSRDQVATILAF